jgi:cell division transport system permease protein
MRALRYAFDEAVASLWRGRRSGALSMATIALALFVLGAFLIVTSNLERLGAEWSSSADMSVYLSDAVTPPERQAIESVLAGDLVIERTYVSKADALARFRSTFADLASGMEGLGDNPLPASYEVRLRTGADQAIDSLVGRVRELPGVADVRYDRQWLARLLAAIGVVRRLGLALGILLGAAAALTVANVVRLALFARRDELDIMQLVGAPQVYIRGPFVMEGTLQGGLAAIVAVAALGITFLALRASYLAPLASTINLSSVRFLPLDLCLWLIVGGMAVGCLGGLVAAAGRT